MNDSPGAGAGAIAFAASANLFWNNLIERDINCEQIR